MKSFIAFLKKEVFECIRSGELTFFCILFLIFGIMNPAIAKLTPWMLETLSDSLAEYYGAAEPPVRCGESHLSGLTEPPHFIY